MHTANCVVDREAGKNFVCFSMLPGECTHHSMRSKLPILRTVTRESVAVYRMIPLHFYLSNLCSCTGFGVAAHLAVDIFPGTSFFDRFIRGTFPSVRKIIPRNSQFVTILAHAKTTKNVHTMKKVLYNLDEADDRRDKNNAAWDIVRLAHQTLQQPYTHCHVLITTKSHGLLAFEPIAMPFRRHGTLSVHGIIGIPPGWPFYIFVCSFFDLEACILKQTVIANTVVPSNVIHVMHSTNQRHF